MIYGQNFVDQPVRNNLITYNNIQKVATGSEMIIRVVVCQTMIIFKNITR